MNNEAYITVEDTTGSPHLLEVVDLVVQDFDNTDIIIQESYEYYFVLHIFYENWSEIQEIVSTIGYIMIGFKLDRFTVTINASELL